MDPNEIIKAAPELLKHGGELVGALKLTEIAKTILGPATGEFAERVKDEIRLYRFGRQLELLKKAEKMVQDAGFTPKAVPIKLLFPLLEGASLEEDDHLHTMFAALLANCAAGSKKVKRDFIDIVQRMSPEEARLIRWVYDEFADNGIDTQRKALLETLARQFGMEESEVLEAFEGLVADGLLLKHESEPALALGFRLYHMRSEHSNYLSHAVYSVSYRGRSFMEACQPPKPRS